MFGKQLVQTGMYELGPANSLAWQWANSLLAALMRAWGHGMTPLMDVGSTLKRLLAKPAAAAAAFWCALQAGERQRHQNPD